MKKEQKPAGRKIDPRSALPSVSLILENESIKKLIQTFTRTMVLDSINEALEWFRITMNENSEPPSFDEVIAKIYEFLNDVQSEQIRPVVNAAGIILHTNLGRAFLPEQAAKALSETYRCCNVQIDMKTGLRGKRTFFTEKLICKITGAEAAVVVNNNAAATFLILAALCKGKEVIISRGQLIEIGGSFRLPDCILQAGAVMREVGTTNKTHLSDYVNAINENTGAILRCNPSNYRIHGFTKSVPIEELAELKNKHNILVIDDLGCGALTDLSKYGLPKEPTAQDSISAGADIACFSGDKLISGPQAGIIIGKKSVIAKIKKHPLTRMLRICKLTDIALQETLKLFLEPDKLYETNPTIRMIAASPDAVKKKAEKLKSAIEKRCGKIKVKVKGDFSEVGGGSLPDHKIETFVLSVSSPKASCGRINYLLRHSDIPVIARISDDEVILDMRTLIEGDEKIIADALEKINGQI